MSRFDEAKQMYAAIGVDAEKALETLQNVTVSVHCWQGDDVMGFDNPGELSGGIQTTGNYPGKATTPEQLMADIDEAFSLMPGKKKLNLHACYALMDDGFVDRDKISPKQFEKWVKFAKDRHMGLDFNPTFFSHSMVKDNLTLSSPDETVRHFWVEHGKRCVEIAEYFANETGEPCVLNIWIPDGYKDIPADRLGPRARFKKSLDEILSIPYDKSKVYVTLESKVFGIGMESYTVGSAEFCLSYVNRNGITPLMDNGHYETKEIAKEIVAHDALDRVFIATDYFDASINRISAWVTGVRSVHKALLNALLQPHAAMKAMQDAADGTQLMVVQEELKTMPFGDVWAEYLRRCGVKADYYTEVKKYEAEVLSKR